MTIEIKSCRLKEMDDAGRGVAVIATLSAVDSDGDTYLAGAFGEQRTKVLAAHNHQAVPIGKARVFEDGDEALAEFQLNLDSTTAKEWHSALKFDLADGRPLQEWSYGFRVLDAGFEDRDGQRIRVLKRLAVHEISPVVLGAGVGTRTVAVKHAPGEDPGNGDRAQRTEDGGQKTDAEAAAQAAKAAAGFAAVRARRWLPPSPSS